MIQLSGSGKKKRWLFALAIIPIAAGLALALRHTALPSSAAPGKTPPPLTLYDRENSPLNRQMVDSGIALLQTGDLAMRTGADATSHMLRQMNQHNKTFSHCGIVVMENGYPFVYHSIGGEDNPDARIRRDSAHFFFSPLNNIGMGIVRLDLNELQNQALVTKALQYFREQRTFDMEFDLASDDKLYCAEFAYKAVLAAVNDTAFFDLSRIGDFRYIGVDNLYENKHAKTICRIQYK